jgi:hypothetical protein
VFERVERKFEMRRAVCGTGGGNGGDDHGGIDGTVPGPAPAAARDTP